MASFRFLLSCFLLLLGHVAVSAQQFNYEVEKRVLDRLHNYLGETVTTLGFIRKLLERGGFPNGLAAPDRDEYLAVSHSLDQTLVYYGSEEGICTGYYFGLGYYREPGYSGYDINVTQGEDEKNKYLNTCVDDSGASVECIHSVGDNYIKRECDVNDATCLVPCPDEASQKGCLADLDGDEKDECEKAVKWCSTYSIETVNEGETLGYIPITNHCHNTLGQFSEVVEGVENTDGSGDISSCYFADGKTLVNRKEETGAFAYCGGNGTVCSGMFEGGYSSGNYDPRYRPWYIETKERQMGTWHDVFPFFTLGLGITYSLPYYKTIDDGRKVFDGVLAVDYRFEDIASFLVEDYQDGVTEIVMFEAKEPHYVIGTSTGTPAAINMLNEDLTMPCPVDTGDNVPCTPVRVKMADLTGHPMDDVLVRAFQRHKEADFPQELLSVLAGDDIDSDFYVSQSAIYSEQAERGLEWRIIVVSPGTKSTGDAITAKDNAGVFAAICSMASLGFFVCASFFWYFYGKRTERSIIHSDWRFTCAFLAGSAILNLSSFALLGENTKATCLTRAWTFNFFFTAALAPLFVKTWRLTKLVGMTNIVRKGISHQQATLYCLPFVAIQVAILLVFTFVDPPAPTEFIENNEGAVTQRVVCDSETHAFWYTEVVYQAGLVAVGCYLAYKSRNLTKEFNEVKPMIFSMYNIAFVGIICALLSNFADFGDGNGRSILQAVGVVWGSVCSTAAFVLPRMLRTEKIIRERKAGGGRSSRVVVSGLNTSLQNNYSSTRNLSSLERSRSNSNDISARNLSSSERSGVIEDLQSNNISTQNLSSPERSGSNTNRPTDLGLDYHLPLKINPDGNASDSNIETPNDNVDSSNIISCDNDEEKTTFLSKGSEAFVRDWASNLVKNESDSNLAYNESNEGV